MDFGLVGNLGIVVSWTISKRKPSGVPSYIRKLKLNIENATKCDGVEHSHSTRAVWILWVARSRISDVRWAALSNEFIKNFRCRRFILGQHILLNEQEIQYVECPRHSLGPVLSQVVVQHARSISISLNSICIISTKFCQEIILVIYIYASIPYVCSTPLFGMHTLTIRQELAAETQPIQYVLFRSISSDLPDLNHAYQKDISRFKLVA